MKARTLSVLAGVGGCLIQGGPASAGFTGINVVSKPNPFGLLVCNVFATFDRPGQDLFLSAGGSPNSPLLIQVIGGTFYQHPFGDPNGRPPNAALLVNPSLAFDTFVTIGVKAVGFIPGAQFPDNMRLTAGWPGFGPSSLSTNTEGWLVGSSDPQADPFNPSYVAGNGQVLIGQFSTAGTAISGMMHILVRSNNVTTFLNVSFFHVPAPGALALLGTAGLLGTRRRTGRRGES